jgi:hypothetical protein
MNDQAQRCHYVGCERYAVEYVATPPNNHIVPACREHAALYREANRG